MTAPVRECKCYHRLRMNPPPTEIWTHWSVFDGLKDHRNKNPPLIVFVNDSFITTQQLLVYFILPIIFYAFPYRAVLEEIWKRGQRQVLYLGEINGSQREAWRKTIEVFEDGAATAHNKGPWEYISSERILWLGLSRMPGGDSPVVGGLRPWHRDALLYYSARSSCLQPLPVTWQLLSRILCQFFSRWTPLRNNPPSHQGFPKVIAGNTPPGWKRVWEW